MGYMEWGVNKMALSMAAGPAIDFNIMAEVEEQQEDNEEEEAAAVGGAIAGKRGG